MSEPLNDDWVQVYRKLVHTYSARVVGRTFDKQLFFVGFQFDNAGVSTCDKRQESENANGK